MAIAVFSFLAFAPCAQGFEVIERSNGGTQLAGGSSMSDVSVPSDVRYVTIEELKAERNARQAAEKKTVAVEKKQVATDKKVGTIDKEIKNLQKSNAAHDQAIELQNQQIAGLNEQISKLESDLNRYQADLPGQIKTAVELEIDKSAEGVRNWVAGNYNSQLTELSSSFSGISGTLSLLKWAALIGIVLILLGFGLIYDRQNRAKMP